MNLSTPSACIEQRLHDAHLLGCITQALLYRRIFGLCKRRVHQCNRLQRQLQNPDFVFKLSDSLVFVLPNAKSQKKSKRNCIRVRTLQHCPASPLQLSAIFFYSAICLNLYWKVHLRSGIAANRVTQCGWSRIVSGNKSDTQTGCSRLFASFVRAFGSSLLRYGNSQEMSSPSKMWPIDRIPEEIYVRQQF